MIAAVLFDLDETLFDRTATLGRFLADQHRRHAAALAVESVEWERRFLELDRRGMVAKSIVYPQLLAEIGGDSALSTTLLAEYRETCARFALPVAGMADTLRALRARGLKLGIVSNGETDIQTRSITALGLEALVDTVLISESEGLRKPDAAMFRRAADKLGVGTADCLFVGDSPEADILGAHAAGMRTAWFSSGLAWAVAPAAPPGHTIHALLDVLAIVEPPQA